VPEGKSVPEGLAATVNVLKAPVNTMYVDSSAIVSLMSYIDKGLDPVKFVTIESDGWYIDKVKEYMDQGKIKYAGKYSSPDFEMLTSGGTQMAICTTMVNSLPDMLQKFDELKIPYLVETSSKEDHPLGRVEWLKLIGVITGNEEAANAGYEDQKAKIDAVGKKPKTGKTVAMFYLASSGNIYVRNNNDYIVKMIRLAGGDYVPADLEPEKTGNTTMTFEDFYASVRDADYIFFMSYGLKFKTLEDFKGYNELMKELNAVKNNKIWYTHDAFSQSMHAIGNIIEDMNTVLTAEGDVDTYFLIKMK